MDSPYGKLPGISQASCHDGFLYKPLQGRDGAEGTLRLPGQTGSRAEGPAQDPAGAGCTPPGT